MKLFLFFIIMINICCLQAQTDYPILKKLDKELRKQPIYLQKKRTHIDSLKKNAEKTQFYNDDHKIYQSYIQLFQEYKSFKYDSAYFYIDKAKELAIQMNDSLLIARTNINESFILLSSGLFKEASDILNTLNPASYSSELKYDYYFLMARFYYDLSDYNDDLRFRIKYVRKGNSFLEKAIAISSKNSPQFYAATGLMELKQQNWAGAENAFLSWLQLIDPDEVPDQYGIAISSLSYAYEQQGNIAKAIESIGKAAISDVQNSTKENIALRNLANLLFQKGMLEEANRYLHLAMKDATFYNARQRKIQISSILPIVEGAQLYKLEQRNNNLQIIIVALFLLFGIAIILLLVIKKQLKQKNEAKKSLSIHIEELKKVNQSLTESDTIKQYYLAYFLNATSTLIQKLGRMQKSTIHKIKTKHPEEVLNVLKKFSVKKERRELFQQFDEVFLKLFPSFIEKFYALFPIEERKTMKHEKFLSTELRIFALYRLGIQDSKQVADFLEISVATVYTYKTRIKSKSLYKNNFEEKIMSIKRL